LELNKIKTVKETQKEKKVRIYGAGGHSQVIKLVLEDNNYEIVDVFDDNPSSVHRESKNVMNGVKANVNNFPHDGYPIIIAVESDT